MKKFIVWQNGRLVGIFDTRDEAIDTYNAAFSELYEIAGTMWDNSIALFENIEEDGEVHAHGYDKNGNELSCGWREAEVPA